MSDKPATFTKEQAAKFKIDALDEKFKGRESLTFREAFKAGFDITDALYIASHIGMKLECAEFAIRCAESIFKFNPVPVAKKAIMAARACLDNPSLETIKSNNAAMKAARDAAEAHTVKTEIYKVIKATDSKATEKKFVISAASNACWAVEEAILNNPVDSITCTAIAKMLFVDHSKFYDLPQMFLDVFEFGGTNE
jgi:hypothetical protein